MPGAYSSSRLTMHPHRLSRVCHPFARLESATWKDVLMPSDRTVKAAVLLGVGLGFFQQASGSEVRAANIHSPSLFF